MFHILPAVAYYYSLSDILHRTHANDRLRLWQGHQLRNVGTSRHEVNVERQWVAVCSAGEGVDVDVYLLICWRALLLNVKRPKQQRRVDEQAAIGNVLARAHSTTKADISR